MHFWSSNFLDYVILVPQFSIKWIRCPNYHNCCNQVCPSLCCPIFNTRSLRDIRETGKTLNQVTLAFCRLPKKISKQVSNTLHAIMLFKISYLWEFLSFRQCQGVTTQCQISLTHMSRKSCSLRVLKIGQHSDGET